jgi:hypothetical protein
VSFNQDYAAGESEKYLERYSPHWYKNIEIELTLILKDIHLPLLFQIGKFLPLAYMQAVWHE